MAAIEVQSLKKIFKVHSRAPGLGAALKSFFHREYRSVTAVDAISFSIEPGEIVGFLGPNGAGKTTTLKMLSGLLHPTSGEVRVMGFRPTKRESSFLKQIMLLMGQKQQLLWDLPPADTFELNRAVYDVDRKAYRQHLAELVELLNIEDVILRPTRQLSLGERMKCELAAALIHRPSILFLDEPTIGLDVPMQSTVREFVRTYNQRHGATVLLTSHYMQDVAALSKRVIIIDRGSISYDGSLDQFARRIKPEKRIVLQLREPLTQALPKSLGEVVSFDGLTVILKVKQAKVSECVTYALATLPVQDLTVEDPPLEAVMSEYFARSKKAAE